MLNKHWQRTSAFGLLNATNKQVRSDLERVLWSARAHAQRLKRPTTELYPLSRLRRDLAHALRMDVVFYPKVREKTVYPRPNSPMTVIDRTPVWKVAKSTDYKKAIKLSSLFTTIVKFGYKAKIVHDLVRLANLVWHLSLKDFSGLCRRILSKISYQLKVERSSPDPLERLVALSNNPILRNRVCRNPSAKKKTSGSSRPCPGSLDTLVFILNLRLRRKRRKRG